MKNQYLSGRVSYALGRLLPLFVDVQLSHWGRRNRNVRCPTSGSGFEERACPHVGKGGANKMGDDGAGGMRDR